jgi:hypothetical protein
MGQVLRITFNNIDYHYQVLTTPVSKETREIQILLDGTTETLIREQGQWLAKETAGRPVPELLAAIARTLSLRYRI